MARAPRLAVIAVVGVLAVGMGLAAGSFLVAQRNVAIGSAASYVPADAPFYLEVRLEPSEAQDGALREVLGRFPEIEGVDLERPLYAQAVESIDEMLLAKGTQLSWAEDVAPWFDGRLAMAVTDLPPELFDPAADPMAEPPAPPVVVLLGVTDRDAAEAAIERILAEAGDDVPDFEASSHAGFTIYASSGGDGAYVLTDDQLLFASGPDDLRAALDTRASGTDTIDAVAEMTRLTERLPDDWVAFATYDLTEALATAAEAGASAQPSAAAAMREMLASQSLRGAVAVSAAGDRFLVDAATDPPSGDFAVENAERGLADEIPADALYYSEGGNIGASLAAVIESTKAAIADAPDAGAEVDTIEAALGADLEELVSWIEDGALAIGVDAGEPWAGLVLVPNDREAAERRLGQLASFASLAAMDSSSGVSVSEAEETGVTITTIRWEDPAAAEGDPLMAAPPAVVVEYAVTDDRVLVGVGDRFVRRALDLDAADALDGVDRYTDAVAELGGSSNASVAWIDLAGTREALESALGPMAGALGAMDAYEAEVRPWLLPLDRFVAVTRLDGDVLVQRSALLVE